jgi:hypothetical protein
VSLQISDAGCRKKIEQLVKESLAAQGAEHDAGQ